IFISMSATDYSLSRQNILGDPDLVVRLARGEQESLSGRIEGSPCHGLLLQINWLQLAGGELDADDLRRCSRGVVHQARNPNPLSMGRERACSGSPLALKPGGNPGRSADRRD